MSKKIIVIFPPSFVEKLKKILLNNNSDYDIKIISFKDNTFRDKSLFYKIRFFKEYSLVRFFWWNIKIFEFVNKKYNLQNITRPFFDLHKKVLSK